jgi:hypothetical protein
MTSAIQKIKVITYSYHLAGSTLLVWFSVIEIKCNSQGYFCGGMAFQNLLPGISITNTLPLWPNFGLLYAFWNLFFLEK